LLFYFKNWKSEQKQIIENNKSNILKTKKPNLITFFQLFLISDKTMLKAKDVKVVILGDAGLFS
jgi:hypothetical protein